MTPLERILDSPWSFFKIAGVTSVDATLRYLLFAGIGWVWVIGGFGNAGLIARSFLDSLLPPTSDVRSVIHS